MILVTGSVHARPGADALRAHFGVPASRAFAKELGTLAARPPEMAIYEATPASL